MRALFCECQYYKKAYVFLIGNPGSKQLLIQSGIALLSLLPDRILSNFKVYVFKKESAKQINNSQAFNSNKKFSLCICLALA